MPEVDLGSKVLADLTKDTCKVGSLWRNADTTFPSNVWTKYNGSYGFTNSELMGNSAGVFGANGFDCAYAGLYLLIYYGRFYVNSCELCAVEFSVNGNSVGYPLRQINIIPGGENRGTVTLNLVALTKLAVNDVVTPQIYPTNGTAQAIQLHGFIVARLSK